MTIHRSIDIVSAALLYKNTKTGLLSCMLHATKTGLVTLVCVTCKICASRWSLLSRCLSRSSLRARFWSSQNTAHTFMNFSPSAAVNCHNHTKPSQTVTVARIIVFRQRQIIIIRQSSISNLATEGNANFTTNDVLNHECPLQYGVWEFRHGHVYTEIFSKSLDQIPFKTSPMTEIADIEDQAWVCRLGFELATCWLQREPFSTKPNTYFQCTISGEKLNTTGYWKCPVKMQKNKVNIPCE